MEGHGRWKTADPSSYPETLAIVTGHPKATLGAVLDFDRRRHYDSEGNTRKGSGSCFTSAQGIEKSCGMGRELLTQFPCAHG